MSLWSPGFDSDLPTAYGGCTCHCHTTEGVKHVMACCYPSDDEQEQYFDEVSEAIDDEEDKADLE